MPNDKILHPVLISEKTHARLTAFCDNTKYKVGATADEAMNEYLDKEEKKAK